MFLVQITFLIICPKQDNGKHPWNMLRIMMSAACGVVWANQILRSLSQNKKETSEEQHLGSCSRPAPHTDAKRWASLCCGLLQRTLANPLQKTPKSCEVCPRKEHFQSLSTNAAHYHVPRDDMYEKFSTTDFERLSVKSFYT